MTKLFVSKETIVINNPTGESALFKAGVERPLRESLEPYARAKGITEVKAAPRRKTTK